MNDLQSIAQAQHVFWNSEATRRWVTEQARIDRLMADVTEAALAAAAPKRGERALDVGCGTGTTVLRLAEASGRPVACWASTSPNNSWHLPASVSLLLASIKRSLCLTTRQPITSRPKPSTLALVDLE